MKTPVDLAVELVQNPKAFTDPVAEFERLLALAAPEDRFKFTWLAEGLVRAMNGMPDDHSRNQ